MKRNCASESGRRVQRGLTLLEVVIALMLFAIMSTVLLTGQGTAARSIEKAAAMRDMAELIGFRLNIIALQPDEYEDGDTGEFPASGKSTRIVNEEDVFGDLYEGYTWEVRISETIGSGAGGSVSIDGQDPLGALFAEEGGSGGGESDSSSDEFDEEVEAGDVDRMLLISVTVFPPNWDEADRDAKDAVQPRTAWTAVPLPEEPDTEVSGP